MASLLFVCGTFIINLPACHCWQQQQPTPIARNVIHRNADTDRQRQSRPPQQQQLQQRHDYSSLRLSHSTTFFDDVPWQSILDDIATEIQPYLVKGTVASYIPALAQVDPNQFGIAFTDLTGATYKAGPNANTPFSIQSISKVFALVMALDLEGEGLWERVGREPSGSKFNSIVQLESEQGRPRNPFINAGAIAVTNSILQHYNNDTATATTASTTDNISDDDSTVAIQKLLEFLQSCAQSNEIRIDPEVAQSEALYGDRNRALAYFMRSYGIVRGDVSQTLNTYFHQCALEMSVATLSRAGLFLAAAGQNPLVATATTTTDTRDGSSDERRRQRIITSHEIVDRVNSIMMLSGHYDMSGDFAFRVGLPGKSGVGGGILAVVPEVGTIAVWSPRLNKAGNSYAGTLALEWFSKRRGVNLF